mmetsp:Transcript_85766/g.151327  ORF Transcript_85766/g.151327 Transcript_85766/m.151327 type:complete len:95 (+) Transcript_85766:18-302(+)
MRVGSGQILSTSHEVPCHQMAPRCLLHSVFTWDFAAASLNATHVEVHMIGFGEASDRKPISSNWYVFHSSQIAAWYFTAMPAVSLTCYSPWPVD